MLKLTLTVEGMRHLDRMRLPFQKDHYDDKLWSLKVTDESVTKFIDINHVYTDELSNIKHKDTDCILGYIETGD